MRRSEQRRHDARNLGVIGVSAFAGLIATAAIVLFNASPAAWLALRGAPPIAIAFAAADPEPMPASVRCHDPLAGLAGLAEAVPGSRVLVTPSGERHALADPALSAASRLFGTVHTRDGATHRGFLRWDRNEGAWADLLHAKKFDHGFSAVAPTWRWGRPGVSGMRFGHIASIVPMSRSHAIVHLRSGQEVGVEALGTDLGRAMRSLTVTPPLVAGADAGVQGPGAGGGAARGQAPQPQVVLEWEDLKRVDFEAAPAGAEAPAAEDRLYGTLTTTGGAAFTGLITWDMDEIFAGDVLDGDGLCAPAPGVFEEEGRRRRGGRRDDKVRRAVPFAAIQTIWQRGSSAAEVELLTGERITLSGTNDVNARNRGITVSDPGIGLVTVPWSRFARVDFKSGADVHEARGGDAEAVGAADSDLGGAGTACGFRPWRARRSALRQGRLRRRRPASRHGDHRIGRAAGRRPSLGPRRVPKLGSAERPGRRRRVRDRIRADRADFPDGERRHGRPARRTRPDADGQQRRRSGQPGRRGPGRRRRRAHRGVARLRRGGPAP